MKNIWEKFYKIRKGWHFSTPILPKLMFYKKRDPQFIQMQFVCKFDENCWYPKQNKDSYDLNKLTGFSFGFNHLKNSVRIAWVPSFEEQGSIHLYLYFYENGRRWFKYITTVKVEEEFVVNINHSKMLHSDQEGVWDVRYMAFVVINTNNQNVVMKEVWEPKIKKFGFLLKPYFGGNNRAPRKMKIMVNKTF